MKPKLIRATTVSMSLDTFCNGMLRELSQRYEVVALSNTDDLLDAVGAREGVRTIGVPMERRISLGRDLSSLIRMIRVFRREKPQVVHSMTPKAGLLCMVAACLCRVPVRIHTFTGLVWPTARGLKRCILMTTDWLTCLCATHVIPEGEGVKHDLLHHGITRKPLRVLGYGNVRGIDLQVFDRRPEVLTLARQTFPITEGQSPFVFLYVGRMVGDKGIAELVEAFCALPNRQATRLWLVGRYEDEDPIPAATRHLIDTTPEIQYLGPRYADDLLACYASAHCFVLPSYREGFPNTVIEAGAMQLPSIVTDINGSREIIEHGVNGLIVPPRDAQALRQAMSTLCSDDVLRQRMAASARPMIAQRFEQSFVRQCLYDFYDSVIRNL